ncbi:MAG TPA: AraC family transcriptional regulator [Opitutaceae bacterium]|nr:AraC family transcriptional regulator [Opitutaceae bacterium]HND61788.1 AraC family transcriptional regulator [Opitutaceae bacterium]
MPKTDHRPWHDPFTAHGLRPPAGAGGDRFQLHECGALPIGPEWNFRDVRSPFWRLYHGLKPGAWIESGGRRYPLAPDRVLLVPDGVTFHCGSRAGALHLWLHFSLYLSLTNAGAGILTVPAGRTVRAVAQELHRAIQRRDPHPAAHLGAALLHGVFAAVGPEAFETASGRMRTLLEWVQHRLGGEITNAAMAAQVGLSPEAFIRWFKSRTGQTPAAFVAERRIREACRRLTFSADSIEQVAEAVGFANRHHFSRVFKRHAGCGPAGFRRDRGRAGDGAAEVRAGE